MKLKWPLLKMLFRTCQPDDERFWKFADYVVENYLDAGCDFPPNLCAESPDLKPAIGHRNGCESCHAPLNADFYSAQPNIYLFVETLLRQQTSTYIFGVTFTVMASSREQQRGPRFCDARTLATARDICPENRPTCGVYHTDSVLLECFIAPLVAYFYRTQVRFCF